MQGKEYQEAIKFYKRAYDIYYDIEGDTSERCAKIQQEMGRANEEAGHN